MQSEAFAKIQKNSSNTNFLPVDLNTPSVSLKAAHAVATPLLKPCCPIHKVHKLYKNATFITHHKNHHKRNIFHSAYERSQTQYFPYGTPKISDATFFSKHRNCEKCNILIPMYHTATSYCYLQLEVQRGRVKDSILLHNIPHNTLRNKLCTILHNTLCTILHNTLCTILHNTLHNTLCTILHNTLHNTLCTILHNTLCTILHNTLCTILHNILHNTLHNTLRYILPAAQYCKSKHTLLHAL